MHMDETDGRHWQHSHPKDFSEEDNSMRFVEDDIADDILVDEFIIEDAVVEKLMGRSLTGL